MIRKRREGSHGRVKLNGKRNGMPAAGSSAAHGTTATDLRWSSKAASRPFNAASLGLIPWSAMPDRTPLARRSRRYGESRIARPKCLKPEAKMPCRIAD
jgi:hypothetical protein